MIRILQLGQRGPTNLESSFERAFLSLGCAVDFVDTSGMAIPLGAEGGLVRRVAMRMLRPTLARGYGIALPEWARFRRYDLVFCHKALLLPARAVRAIADRSRALLFCFYPDRPLDPHPSRATVEDRRLIAECDCFFTFGHFMFDEIRAAGARRVEYLPFAHDPALHSPPLLDAPARSTLRAEVAFVGNYSDERARLLRHLLDFDLAIWGHRWQRAFSLDPRFQRAVRGGAQEGRDFARIYAAADIGLNLIQVYPDGHNMRSFEAPACGGFVLSTRTRELSALFREGEEIACFAGPSELHEKVAFYLAHPDERARIAAAGRARVVNDTYARRAARVLEVLDEELARRRDGSIPPAAPAWPASSHR